MLNRRLLCVSKAPLIRKGLKHLVEPANSLVECDELIGGFKLLRTKPFDAMILGPCFETSESVPLIKQLRLERPTFPVLVFYMPGGESDGITLLRAGVAACLSAECEVGIINEALTKILRGGKFVTHELAMRLVEEVQRSDVRNLHEDLSKRELEILLRLVEGESNKEIANALRISQKTVSTYRMRILKKMKMNNIAQLMHYAIANGLIPSR